MAIRARVRITEGVARGECGKCEHALIREFDTETEVRCGWFHPSVLVTRMVVSCNAFEAKGQITKREMERQAWILETKKGQPIGFVAPNDPKWKAIREEDL